MHLPPVSENIDWCYPLQALNHAFAPSQWKYRPMLSIAGIDGRVCHHIIQRCSASDHKRRFVSRHRRESGRICFANWQHHQHKRRLHLLYSRRHLLREAWKSRSQLHTGIVSTCFVSYAFHSASKHGLFFFFNLIGNCHFKQDYTS